MYAFVDRFTDEMGEPLKDGLSIALMLSSFPESYNSIVIALEVRSDDDLTIELVKGKLIHEYLRRQSAENSSDTALKTFHKQSHSNQSFNKNRAKTDKKCFNCGKLGHFKDQCWLKKKDPDKLVKKVTAADDDDEGSSSGSAICFQLSKPDKDEWVIDSAATSHICGNKKFFESLNEFKVEDIYLADGSVLKSKGIGYGSLKTSRNYISLKNVLYVPEIQGNLISVRKIVENGLNLCFKDNNCEIKNKDVVVADARKENGLYKLHLDNKVMKVTGVTSKADLETWHRRLGHRNVNDAKKLYEGSLVEGMKISNFKFNDVCEACLMAKSKRKPFPKQSLRTTENCIDIVHTDICGPIDPISPSGNRYVMTFTDDYSR